MLYFSHKLTSFYILFYIKHNYFIYLATVDVKRNIFDMCTDSKDYYLAVIEVN